MLASNGGSQECDATHSICEQTSKRETSPRSTANREGNSFAMTPNERERESMISHSAKHIQMIGILVHQNLS